MKALSRKGGIRLTEQQIRSIMQQSREKGCTALFETYYNYVYAVVFRYVRKYGTTEDIEECVVDVFAQVMAHFPDIREGTLKAYLSAAAKNRALNLCRTLYADASQTVSIDEDSFSRLADTQDVAAGAEQRALTKQVLDCIESLGQPDSSLILQRYYLGHSAAEIARTLHMNPVTVRSRLHRAVKRLRKLLQDRDITL